MEIKKNPAKVDSIRIEGAPALDPVTVFFEDFEPHTGRVTVVCYGESWTAFFGSMHDETIRDFVKCAPVSYLANKLLPYPGKLKVKAEKEQYRYLERIVAAIKDAIQ